METNFYTIQEEKEILIEEKSSKFFGLVFHVEKEEEVKSIIDELWKKNRGARHIVYAYKLIDNGKEYLRYSDDGEPQGTAGQPILKIIEAGNLKNVLLVVIRYFGGILLGAGLLGRTYMNAAKRLVEESDIVEAKAGREECIEIDYKDVKYIKILLENNNARILKQEYLQNVSIFYEITNEDYEKFKENISSSLIDYKVILSNTKYIMK